MENAGSFNIDINAKDNNGRNGFQLAKFHDSTEVVNFITKKWSNITL